MDSRQQTIRRQMINALNDLRSIIFHEKHDIMTLRIEWFTPSGHRFLSVRFDDTNTDVAFDNITHLRESVINGNDEDYENAEPICVFI